MKLMNFIVGIINFHNINSMKSLLRTLNMNSITEPLTIPLETINSVFGVEEKCHHIRVNPSNKDK